jgi:hypothetical protein
MFHAGLANLFKPLVIGHATAHSIKILRDHRVAVVTIGKPLQILNSRITGVSSYGKANLSPDSGTKLR